MTPRTSAALAALARFNADELDDLDYCLNENLPIDTADVTARVRGVLTAIYADRVNNDADRAAIFAAIDAAVLRNLNEGI